MKRAIFCGILISGLVLTNFSYAFFVGFGASGAAEQVITGGQVQGLIPLTPGGETSPKGPGAEVVWQKVYNRLSQNSLF